MHKGTLSIVAVGAAALFGFAAQQKSARRRKWQIT